MYNDYNSVTCNAETTKHRCHPHCCKRKYIKGTNKGTIYNNDDSYSNNYNVNRGIEKACAFAFHRKLDVPALLFVVRFKV